jgi:hypothetical protein
VITTVPRCRTIIICWQSILLRLQRNIVHVLMFEMSGSSVISNLCLYATMFWKFCSDLFEMCQNASSVCTNCSRNLCLCVQETMFRKFSKKLCYGRNLSSVSSTQTQHILTEHTTKLLAQHSMSQQLQFSIS